MTRTRIGLVAAILLALLAFALPAQAQRPPAANGPSISIAELPPEAQTTLALIRKGGPFPYAKDGRTFGNREARLPPQRRGYYREYTVKTPGERTRGARRIVVGRGGEMYYTDDHYNQFRRIRE